MNQIDADNPYRLTSLERRPNGDITIGLKTATAEIPFRSQPQMGALIYFQNHHEPGRQFEATEEAGGYVSLDLKLSHPQGSFPIEVFAVVIPSQTLGGKRFWFCAFLPPMGIKPRRVQSTIWEKSELERLHISCRFLKEKFYLQDFTPDSAIFAAYYASELHAQF
jgi:hypothetical protein